MVGAGLHDVAFSNIIFNQLAGEDLTGEDLTGEGSGSTKACHNSCNHFPKLFDIILQCALRPKRSPSRAQFRCVG